MPTEIYTVSYRGWLHFEKAIKAWRAATDINSFKKQVSGVNDFSYELKAEDGKTEYAHVVFLFDDRIELPKEAEQAAANAEQSSVQPNS